MTAKKAKKVLGTASAEVKAPVVNAKKFAGASALKVKDGNGAVIREYSKKVHGEDFVDYAVEFASKVASRTVEEA